MVIHALRAYFLPTLIGTILSLAGSGSVFAQVGGLPEFERNPNIVHKITSANERLEMTVATSRILTLDVKIPQAQVNNPDILDLTLDFIYTALSNAAAEIAH